MFVGDHKSSINQIARLPLTPRNHVSDQQASGDELRGKMGLYFFMVMTRLELIDV